MHGCLFQLTSKPWLCSSILHAHSLAPGIRPKASFFSTIRHSLHFGQRPLLTPPTPPTISCKFKLKIGCTQIISKPLSPARVFSTSALSFSRHHVPRPQQKPLFLGFLDKISPNVILYGIIGLNVVVFMMWSMAIQKYQLKGDPSAIFWMEENFLNSWKNLTSGRIWTPLAACFSHRDWSHILLNGFTFYFMAPIVLQIIGSRQFVFLYMGGGLISSFASVAYAKLTGKQNYASHGASGAIYSVVSLLACVAPTLTFQLYGIIPVPAWLAVSGFFSYDLYSTLSEKNGTTDTVGHIGGMIAGVCYFIMRRFRVF